MATILQLYAKRLEKIDLLYNNGKMTKGILEKELKSVARDLLRLAKRK